MQKTIEKFRNPIVSVINIKDTKGFFRLFKDTILEVHTNPLMNNIYTKLKDVTLLLDQSGLIYYVECECSLCYVSQTIQKLRNRIYDHKYTT